MTRALTGKVPMQTVLGKYFKSEKCPPVGLFSFYLISLKI